MQLGGTVVLWITEDGSEGETAGSFDKTYKGYLIQDIFGEVDSMHNFPEELMSKLRLRASVT